MSSISFDVQNIQDHTIGVNWCVWGGGLCYAPTSFQGAWHHYVYTFTPSGVTIYFDGSARNSNPVVLSTSGKVVIGNSGLVRDTTQTASSTMSVFITAPCLRPRFRLCTMARNSRRIFFQNFSQSAGVASIAKCFPILFQNVETGSSSPAL